MLFLSSTFSTPYSTIDYFGLRRTTSGSQYISSPIYPASQLIVHSSGVTTFIMGHISLDLEDSIGKYGSFEWDLGEVIAHYWGSWTICVLSGECQLYQHHQETWHYLSRLLYLRHINALRCYATISTAFQLTRYHGWMLRLINIPIKSYTCHLRWRYYTRI